jgi:hypothetical protein
MTFLKRFFPLCMIALCFIAAPLATRVATMPASDASCVEVDAWLDSGAANMPQTLDQIAAYPSAYRYRVFDRLQPEVKSRMWIEHLTRFSEQPGLTSAQQGYLRGVIATIGPARYVTGAVGDPKARADRHAALLAMFPSKQHRLVLAELGRPLSAQTSIGFMPFGSSTMFRDDDEEGLPNCWCNTSEDWCWTGNTCRYKVNTCKRLTTGCGDWWEAPCNGRCLGYDEE